MQRPVHTTLLTTALRPTLSSIRARYGLCRIPVQNMLMSRPDTLAETGCLARPRRACYLTTSAVCLLRSYSVAG